MPRIELGPGWDGALKRKDCQLIELDQLRWLPVARRAFDNDLEQGRLQASGCFPRLETSSTRSSGTGLPTRVAKCSEITSKAWRTGSNCPRNTDLFPAEQMPRCLIEGLLHLLRELLAHPVAAVAASARAACLDYLLLEADFFQLHSRPSNRRIRLGSSKPSRCSTWPPQAGHCQQPSSGWSSAALWTAPAPPCALSPEGSSIWQGGTCRQRPRQSSLQLSTWLCPTTRQPARSKLEGPRSCPVRQWD